MSVRYGTDGRRYHRTRPRRLIVRFLLLVVAVAFAAASPTLAGKKNDTLNIAWEKELETLDRYFNTAREGIIVGRMIFDSLIHRNPETYEYEPLLAKSFQWIDNLSMEMELREGVTFHNGEAFNADDVVYTLNFVSDPANNVLVQRNVNWIKNAEKLGEYKVRIHLKKPFPAALEYLAGPIPIYPNEYYAKVGPKGFGVEPIGTGPYKVVSVTPGKAITFEKNDDYFPGSPKGQPSIGKIVQRTIPEANTKVAELMTGGLDWIWLVPKDQAEKLAPMPNIEVIAAETMRIGFVYFDASGRSGDTPFTDLKVRRAVCHAVDREAMSKHLVGGQSRVVHSICYPSQFGCTDEGVKKYEYDPKKAKQLLAEAGYPDGFETEFYAYRDRPYAEAIIGYLKDVGITAKLKYMKYAALRERYQGNKCPMTFWTWGSYSVNDISAITGYWFKGHIDDYARDKQVQEWLEIGDTSIDPKIRKDVYQKALARIAEKAYALPLFTWVSNYAFTKELDFTPYPDSVPRFFLSSWK
jgi:peptide/nickel transport system substrate-binding protein